MAARKWDFLRFSRLLNYENVSQNFHIYTKQGNGIDKNKYNHIK